MNIVSRVILLIALVSLLTMGLVVSGCPGGPGPNSEQNDIALGRITGVSRDSAQSFQLGGPAPDFYFETPEGEPSSLSQLQGKPVLVNFWATWCAPCRLEMPYLQQVYEEWPEDELALLTINVGESPSEVAAFLQNQGLSFPVLLDTTGELTQRYSVLGIPSTFFIDKYGLVHRIKIGSFQSQAEIESILNELD